MANENKTVFGTFTEAVGIYLQHLPTFLKYMTFPVLGSFQVHVRFRALWRL